MIRLFLLSERQMARISPYFPLSHGGPRVDDRRVVSGCDPQWPAMEGGTARRWPAQDSLQPLHPLEQARRV